MSHSVTITRTTTSTANASYIIINTGYVKTMPGLLKLLELAIGIAVVVIMMFNYKSYNYSYPSQQDLFVYLMSTTFMIGTLCLLIACIVTLNTGAIISKTIYEVVYHSVAAVLLLLAGLFMLLELRHRKHDAYTVAGVLCTVNAILYFISAFLANRAYKY